MKIHLVLQLQEKLTKFYDQVLPNNSNKIYGTYFSDWVLTYLLILMLYLDLLAGMFTLFNISTAPCLLLCC